MNNPYLAATTQTYFLGNFMPASFITSFSMVGYTMVAGIGFNFILRDFR